MQNPLRQGTSVTVRFGPIVNPTDGVTVITTAAGTGANQFENVTTGLMLSKNGGTYGLRNGTPGASVFDSSDYKVVLNTTDTGTLGLLRVSSAHIAAYAPYAKDFTVLPANVYDSLIAGVANTYLNANVAAIAGNINVPALLAGMCEGAMIATVDAAITPPTQNQFSCSSIQTGGAAVGSTASFYNGKQVTVLTGALAGQYLGAVSGFSVISAEPTFVTSLASPTGGTLSTGDLVLIAS